MKRNVRFELKTIKNIDVEGNSEVEILNNIKTIISSFNENVDCDVISFYMKNIEEEE